MCEQVARHTHSYRDTESHRHAHTQTQQATYLSPNPYLTIIRDYSAHNQGTTRSCRFYSNICAKDELNRAMSYKHFFISSYQHHQL